nr:adenylate kinase [Streptomyces sp. Xyl84]
MRIVIAGPPGAGKGTQAARLTRALSVPHVSTGALFRGHIEGGTPLGRQAREHIEEGRLVPDGLTLAMTAQRLARPDAAHGFLLDGFPRTVRQATALDDLLAHRRARLDAVLFLDLAEDEIVRRIAGRRVCRADGGHVHHVAHSPGAARGVCDTCGGRLHQRADDREETVRTRLAVHHRETAPLLGHYRERGLAVTVSATGPVDEVTRHALAALTALTVPDEQNSSERNGSERNRSEQGRTEQDGREQGRTGQDGRDRSAPHPVLTG